MAERELVEHYVHGLVDGVMSRGTVIVWKACRVAMVSDLALGTWWVPLLSRSGTVCTHFSGRLRGLFVLRKANDGLRGCNYNFVSILLSRHVVERSLLTHAFSSLFHNCTILSFLSRLIIAHLHHLLIGLDRLNHLTLRVCCVKALTILLMTACVTWGVHCPISDRWFVHMLLHMRCWSTNSLLFSLLHANLVR